MMRTKTRFIPAGSAEVAREGVNAVVYISDTSAIGYSGKRCNHDFHYRFKDVSRRDEYVNEYFDKIKRNQEWKEQERIKNKGKLSEHARTAQAIREELKKNFPNIKFRVKSDSFSMGNSVDVYYTDGPKSSDVDAIVGKYQYGHFDGMIDMYENSNSRDDIPQVKYVMVNREMSDTTKSKIIETLNKKYGDYDFANEHQMIFGEWAPTHIYREFQGNAY